MNFFFLKIINLSTKWLFLAIFIVVLFYRLKKYESLSYYLLGSLNTERNLINPVL